MPVIEKNALPWLIGGLALALCFKNPAIGLALGAAIALTFGNKAKSAVGKASKLTLQIAVSLLGFKLQFGELLHVGATSVWLTFITIALTMGLGLFLGRLFLVKRDISVLISGGTAICGGSAIAALAPTIGASQADMAVAMAVVFLLNAVGLIVFPIIGHVFDMSQTAFGLWAALAIHDTSSVVGAGAAYGQDALRVATTVKLTRALWILPLTLAVAFFLKTKASGAKIPPFIYGFIATSLLATFVPFGALWGFCGDVGGRLMTVTLFLVGACLTREDVMAAGVRPLLKAVVLWIAVSVLSFLAIRYGLISIQL